MTKSRCTPFQEKTQTFHKNTSKVTSPGSSKTTKITKIYDDITEPIVDYVFPAQKHGTEETIIKAVFYYTNNYKTEKIKVLQSIFWNDDDFDYEDAITAIN